MFQTAPISSYTLFNVVLAAPHSRLRKTDDRASRMIDTVQNPTVRILAHPRGRITGSRPGVVADWSRVFAIAAKNVVGVEIDGDPSRQDVDYTMARDALAAGCVFALGSDTDSPGSWSTRRRFWPKRDSPASRATASSIAGRWSASSLG